MKHCPQKCIEKGTPFVIRQEHCLHCGNCYETGVFMFPNKRAAELAVQTVKQYKEKTKSKIKVIFNVFKEEDERLYKQLLG